MLNEPSFGVGLNVLSQAAAEGAYGLDEIGVT